MIAIGMKLQATLAVDDVGGVPFYCKPLLDKVTQQTTSLDSIVRTLTIDGEMTELEPSLNRYLASAHGLVDQIIKFHDAFERDQKNWDDRSESHRQDLVDDAIYDFYDARDQLGVAFRDVEVTSDTQELFGNIVFQSNVLEGDVNDVVDAIDDYACPCEKKCVRNEDCQYNCECVDIYVCDAFCGPC